MPRRIGIKDIEYQDVPGYPVTVAQRFQEWERTENLHRLNKLKSPASLPPGLELICAPPERGGILLASSRLQRLYEAGIEVISTSDLLFGRRVLLQELWLWDTFVEPGQVLLLTDLWYETILPDFAIPGPWGNAEHYPSEEEWLEFTSRVGASLNRIIDLGALVVMALTPGPLQCSWLELVEHPIVGVRMSALPREPFAVGQYAPTDICVEYRGGALPPRDDYPLNHCYERTTPDTMRQILPLTAVFDYHPWIFDPGHRDQYVDETGFLNWDLWNYGEDFASDWC